MQPWARHPDMIAAWAVALALVFAVGVAPWEKLRAAYPAGVVDVAQQRFELKLPGGAYDRGAVARHDSDLRDVGYSIEGL